jgi:hypothetical protein
MYFNHAYQKTLIATDIHHAGPSAVGIYKTTGTPVATFADTSANPTNAGKVAIVASLTTGTYNANQTISPVGGFTDTIQDLPMIYLAQATINTVDKLGPFAGGYKESVKTKGINPKYVSKFFVNVPTCAQAEVRKVCLCDGAAAQCGTSYYLRIDVKGSPALRFLTHNAYRTYASDNICCPANPTVPADLDVDSMQIIADWAWQISRDPIMNNFILGNPTWNNGSFNAAGWFAAHPNAAKGDMYTALQSAGAYTIGTPYDPATSSAQCLELVGSYVDTQFGTCSFHPQDFYELAPVKIYTSITDQQGDPCVDQIFCTTQDPYQLAQQGNGYGHKLLRDAILFRRYMQEQYVYDPRLREVMNQDQVYTWIVGTSFYTTYGILHSVPRFNNPTGVFDNDQYLVTIVMPASACNANTRDVNDFELWMNEYLAAAGNGVQLEVVI